MDFSGHIPIDCYGTLIEVPTIQICCLIYQARGGGIIFISSQTINFTGSIQANGAGGTTATGSGSGGSIWIEANTVTLSNTITANGGTGSIYGGKGRIAIYYYTSYTATVTPDNLQQLDLYATLTPTITVSPTVTRTPTGTPATATQTSTPTSTPTTIPTGWQTRDYTYDQNIPHAVSSVTSNQSPLGTYTYDANGNMTCRIEDGVTYKQNYNTENRISSIAKITGDCTTFTVIESWSYLYDGDGTRVQEDYFVGTTLTSTKKYYFGGAYETHSDNTIIKYYSFSGVTIMDDGNGLKYLLTDHLGSTVAITDEAGLLVSEQRYLPFGGLRSDINDITQTDYGYTGQRDLDGTGLMDYKFRFYSPYLNRFIQPDSIVPNMMIPQMLNRFSYVGNNPINFNDPTGHVVCDEEGNCNDGSIINAGNYVRPKPKLPKPKDEREDGEKSLVDEISHYYEISNVVCPTEWHCTQEQMIYYLSLFAYPGQNPANGPALPNTEYSVSPPFGWFPESSGLYDLGLIQVVRSNGGLTSTNVTQPSHIFCCGTVTRSLTQDSAGNWSVTTVGKGSNTSQFIANVNNSLGPGLFENADKLMFIYIADQKFPDTYSTYPPLWNNK